MFVWSKKFVDEHVGRISDTAVYGQESSSTTLWLAMMNVAVPGIE